MRIRIEKGFWTSIWGLTILGLALAFVLSWFGLFTYYYVKYKRMIDARLSGNILQNTTQIFSTPQRIADGQVWSAEELASYLQRVGYRPTSDDHALGQYTFRFMPFSTVLNRRIARSPAGHRYSSFLAT